MTDILKLPFVVGRRLCLPIAPGAFRLFLAFLVFVHHFSSFALGSYAVFVFFILSGFWLQRMWIERYAPTRSPYLTYTISRVWRLAPVMVLVSIMTFAMIPVIGWQVGEFRASHIGHLAFSTIFLLGYSGLDFLPVGPAWSLDVEMQFYVVAPLLSLAIARPRLRWPLLVAAFAGLLYFTDNFMNDSSTRFQHLGTYILFFLIGMTAARTDWRPTSRLAALSACLFVLAVLIVTVSPWRGVIIGGANPGPLFRYRLVFTVGLALASIPFAIHTTTRKSDATDRMMADLSYIIYLLHWIAVMWFYTIVGPFSARLAVAAISFLTVPPAAWAIWRFYDKPINRMRSRWVASRVPGATPRKALAEPVAP
jgi:peptidoglycan/LPS O-acetylase OafA/YrhL